MTIGSGTHLSKKNLKDALSWEKVRREIIRFHKKTFLFKDANLILPLSGHTRRAAKLQFIFFQLRINITFSYFRRVNSVFNFLRIYLTDS